MSKRLEDIYKFNQEQGNPAQGSVGHQVDNSGQSHRMTPEEERLYWEMWEALSEEEKQWWCTEGKKYYD